MEPLPSYSIQPQQPDHTAGAAAPQNLAIEQAEQPGRPNIDQAPPISAPQKKSVNALGLAGHIFGVVGHIAALPFYAAMAPGFLIGAGLANALSDPKDETLGLKDLFQPLTKHFVGIYAASQGMTLKEYKTEAKEEYRRSERIMHSMQTRNYIQQGVEQARQAPNQPALDDTTINTKDALGLTPLMKAQTAGEVRELLTMNADVNVKDEQGLTALMRFAHAGQDEHVSTLLQSNKISSSDCFAAQTAVTTILQYEEDAEARRKYEEIIKALRAYKPPQAPPPQAQLPPRQNQAPREPNMAPPQQNQGQPPQQLPPNPPPQQQPLGNPDPPLEL